MFRGDGLEIEGRDPVHHAAREVVRALIETRWSLEAAVVRRGAASALRSGGGPGVPDPGRPAGCVVGVVSG